jgi:hypothetical protein
MVNKLDQTLGVIDGNSWRDDMPSFRYKCHVTILIR